MIIDENGYKPARHEIQFQPWTTLSIHLFTISLVHLSILLLTFHSLFMHSLIYSFIRSFVRSSIIVFRLAFCFDHNPGFDW